MRAIVEQMALGQPELARKAGVSQASVSRLMERCPTRSGLAFERLCAFAERQQGKASQVQLPREATSIVAAVREVWNGSPEHARALATLIMAARDFARFKPR